MIASALGFKAHFVIDDGAQVLVLEDNFHWKFVNYVVTVPSPVPRLGKATANSQQLLGVSVTVPAKLEQTVPQTHRV